MISAENLISDIREIINAVEDDSDIMDEWLIYKLNHYRAAIILQKYNMDLVIDPSWQLHTEIIQTTQTDPSNDPNVDVSSVSLSKATIPEPIALPNDLGLIITGSGGIVPLESISYTQLAYKASIGQEIDKGMGYYARVGNVAFMYPLLLKIKAIIIPANPMEIKVLDSGAFRERTLTDPYPIDLDSAQAMIIELLTKDLKVKIETIGDLVNDSQDQFKVLADEKNRA
jgi:hypothetical protein